MAECANWFAFFIPRELNQQKKKIVESKDSIVPMEEASLTELVTMANPFMATEADLSN
jgi:hypothetical protein